MPLDNFDVGLIGFVELVSLCSRDPFVTEALGKPTASDLKKRDEVANGVILARWAERCGNDCAENWNATVGSILGLEAKAN